MAAACSEQIKTETGVGAVLRTFWRKHAWKYIPGVIFLLLQSWLQTLLPRILGDAINLLEQRHIVGAEVYRQAGILMAVALGVFLTRFIWRACIVLNARYMEVMLREELFVKLQGLPVSFFADKRSGDMMAYAINDVGAVRMTFGPVLAMGLSGVTTASLSIGSMAGDVSPQMTLLALLPLPITMVVIVVVGRVVQRRFRRVQELFQQLSGFVNESIMGIRVVKTFAREDEWSREFEKVSDDMREASVRLNNVSAIVHPVTAAAFGLSYAISMIIGGGMVMRSEIALGDLVAFLGYLMLIQWPVMQLGRIVNMLQRGIASYQRLNEIYHQPGIPAFELMPGDGMPAGGIRADRLTFTYPGMKSPALRGVSFELGEGQTLGIAGATGSGKSTLVSLLMKFYDAPEGSLLLGGRDIRDIPAVDIRNATGYVPQDGFLFSASVEENIRFYTPSATHEDVLRAAEYAGISDEVDMFPQGFETPVGERGTHLSGGQKQRISLARALIRDPRLLILDDTLSAVDSITEQTIMGYLNGIMGHKTAIIVSHRLTALKSADLILFLEDGAVVERGTHAELMELGGRYAGIYEKQAKGESA